MKDRKGWEVSFSGNDVLAGEKFYISYNPFPCGSEDEETALYSQEKEIFYILDGDFRKEYEKLFNKGFGACKEFYDKMKSKHRSWWSTDDSE